MQFGKDRIKIKGVFNLNFSAGKLREFYESNE